MRWYPRGCGRSIDERRKPGAPRRRRKAFRAKVQGLEERQLLATFTVTSTLDDGSTGTLRWAIGQVNADPGAQVDLINFQITPGSGPFTIVPTSSLPTITHPVTIDGYTQPGAHANSLANGDNAVILVALDGGAAGGADGLTIAAGGSTVRGLAIGGFNNGIRLSGTGGDLISGNFLGTDASGAPRGNGNGMLVDGAPGVSIGGTTPALRNLISANGSQGIFLINGASGALVRGNFIGTDRTGTQRMGNGGNGVVPFHSAGATIGGTSAGARNVISANGENAVDFVGADAGGTLIQGNFMGTDVSGTLRLGNAGAGVLDLDASNNTIGGTAAGARNLISANGGGIGITNQGSGATGNLIQGNLIGTDITGALGLGNTGQGIRIVGASGTTIGGTTAGAGNVITGDSSDDLSIALLGPANLVQGNRIGTDATGMHALGGGPDQHGILITEPANTIGGTAAGARNLISGNGGIGVVIVAGGLDVVQGNLIGVAANGSTALGNGREGVDILFDSAGNSVGGTAAGAGNIVAFNGGAGIATQNAQGTGNTFLSNSIYSNAGLGIDLNLDGVTPNDPGDFDSGSNNLQNFPTVDAAASLGSKLALKGSLNSAPNTTYTLQFFANATADPSGFGEGQTLLGTATVVTDASGNASFQLSFMIHPHSVNFVSATATDPAGNTSEFSADRTVIDAGQPLVAQDDSYLTDENSTLAVAAPGVMANDIDVHGGSFTAVLVSGPQHGTLALNSDGSFTYTPATDFAGTDTFQYKDQQGSDSSNTATVTIVVNPRSLVVVNTNDSGAGSLRSAILTANSATSATPDTILFAIPGSGPFTITPLTPLPAITHPTIIDGYSQPGAQANSLANGDNATILVALDGAALSGADGLTITAGGSTVRGLAIGGFNNGIHLSGAGGDLISGNFLGTDATGAPRGNGNGVFIDGTPGVSIGGTAAALRNVISANGGSGVAIGGAAAGGTLIQGNFIGTDLTGTQRLGNAGAGVLDLDAPNNTIGGTAAGASNVISANGGGIGITNQGSGATGNLIQGNLIGTDVTGAIGLGNTGEGIRIVDASGTTIGGTAAGAGNVITGDSSDDLSIALLGPANLVQGNRIGTDATGMHALGGGPDQHGILITSPANTIGGTAAGAGNLISGNGGIGVVIVAGGLDVVQGNLIGVAADGSTSLGNGREGVDILFDSAGNTVGGTAAGAGNVVAFNGGAGIATQAAQGTGNTFLSNLIYSNAGLGIDLSLNGVTPNDPGDFDSGSNNLQNFPALVTATSDAGGTTITGTLNSAPNTTYTLQFFASTSADPSGFGEGQTLLGTATVITDGAGDAAFTFVFASQVDGQFISATATDPAGNTSEFSADVVASGTALAAIRTPSSVSSGRVPVAPAESSIVIEAPGGATSTPQRSPHPRVRGIAELAADILVQRNRAGLMTLARGVQVTAQASGTLRTNRPESP